MEEMLKKINVHVSLSDAEKKRNNQILLEVLDRIIFELKKEKLFSSLYNRNFHGGSFYDGLKVGSSTEYDIDMLLVLPNKCNPKVVASNKPGFVHITATSEFSDIGESYKGLNNLIDKKTNQISAKKTLSQIEGRMKKSLDQLCPNGKQLCTTSFENKVCDRKSGPAFTINITAKADGEEEIKIDVDLVPCFLFKANDWPSKAEGYRQFDRMKHGNKDTFLAVPKLPTDVSNPDFYWRLSFQEQERKLITGNDFDRLKPSLRLIKKIRDKWDHKKISSYYIKTIFLWEVDERERNFWRKPLFEVFFEMLKVYYDHLKNGSIKYYWNPDYDLISTINRTTLQGFSNKIKHIIGDYERYAIDDPVRVAKHIVSAEELEMLKNEVKIVVNVTKTQPPLFSNNIPNTACTSHEELIRKLRSEKESLSKENFELIRKNALLEEEIRKLRNEIRGLKGDPNRTELLDQLMGLTLSFNRPSNANHLH